MLFDVWLRCGLRLSHATMHQMGFRIILLIINNHDNVYGAAIMTKVIARVHPVHFMNSDRAPVDRQPSDQAR